MESEKRIIEINGIKLEVDMRHAKRVDQFRVGDKVKLMREEGYGDPKTHKVHPGVIVGFEPFKELPTIIVAYLEISYSEAALKFEYINAETKGADLVIAEDDYLPLERHTFSKSSIT